MKIGTARIDAYVYLFGGRTTGRCCNPVQGAPIEAAGIAGFKAAIECWF